MDRVIYKMETEVNGPVAGGTDHPLVKESGSLGDKIKEYSLQQGVATALWWQAKEIGKKLRVTVEVIDD